MKKSLLLLFAAFATLAASAHDFEVNGIYYNITSETDKTVEVTSGGINYSGSITIPATATYNGVTYSVTSIGDGAFAGCWSLTAITIPGSVTRIGNEAFRSCSSLTAITIPEGVTSIGEWAFVGCSSLTAITIPEGVTSIGEWAFVGCSSLTAITIPESLTSIGRDAFSYCSSLTDITIPEGSQLTSIVQEAFSYCSSLTDITIPESVTIIGPHAFEGCSSLTDITIPEGVTSIYGSAFSGCSSLTAIVLPKEMKYIYFQAFANCNELLDVYCYAKSVPSTEASAFDGSYPENVTLHVPANALNAYKSTAPWNSFGNIVALTDEEMDVEQLTKDKSQLIIYDLCGQRIDRIEQGGIYIVNGKKTVIK